MAKSTTPIHQSQGCAANMGESVAGGCATRSGRAGLARARLLEVDGAEALLDASEQPGRQRVLAALLRDHHPELGVEVEDVEAVKAAVDVGVDGLPGLGRELLVEEGLELTKDLFAVIHGSSRLASLAPWRAPGRTRARAEPGLAPRRTRTTPSASTFFP